MKNTFTVNHNRITKNFRSVVSFRKEKAVYRLMKDSGFVPRVYSFAERSIIMEKLEGVSLGRLFYNCHRQDMIKAASRAAECFCGFQKLYYEKTGSYLVNTDSNLRNFITVNGKVKMVDFEETCNGSLQQAMGEFLSAYVSENDLMYECFLAAAEILKKAFPTEDIDGAAVTARSRHSRNMRKRRVMPLIRKSALCIAAGGKSSRMGSPKGLLPFKDHTITDEIIYNLSVFDNMFISANLDEYKSCNLPVAGDAAAEKGPLSAIHTALTFSDSRWVMVCRCDMPFVNRDVVYTLFENITDTAQAVVITCGGKVYPVLGLYHKSALPAVEGRLEKDRLKVMEMLDKINTVYVNYNDRQTVENINTAEEYRIMTENLK